MPQWFFLKSLSFLQIRKVLHDLQYCRVSSTSINKLYVCPDDLAVLAESGTWPDVWLQISPAMLVCWQLLMFLPSFIKEHHKQVFFCLFPGMLFPVEAEELTLCPGSSPVPLHCGPSAVIDVGSALTGHLFNLTETECSAGINPLSINCARNVSREV